jgi:hypothetical protein
MKVTKISGKHPLEMSWKDLLKIYNVIVASADYLKNLLEKAIAFLPDVDLLVSLSLAFGFALSFSHCI